MLLINNWKNNLKKNKIINAYNDLYLSPVSLNDCVNILTEIGKNKISGIHHVSGDRDITYYELALYLCRKLGLNSNLVRATSLYKNEKKSKYKNTVLDCKQFNQTNFVPRNVWLTIDDVMI